MIAVTYRDFLSVASLANVFDSSKETVIVPLHLHHLLIIFEEVGMAFVIVSAADDLCLLHV